MVKIETLDQWRDKDWQPNRIKIPEVKIIPPKGVCLNTLAATQKKGQHNA